MFVRISDHDGKRRASIFFCGTPGDAGNEQLTGGLRHAFSEGCSGRRPGHNFHKAIDRHGLCMLHGAAPMTIFLRLKGVQGGHSRRQLILGGGHRTLTG